MISRPLITGVDAIPLLDRAVFLDARGGPDSKAAYRHSHVAGAIHVDLETDLSECGDPAQGGRHPLPSLPTWLERVGNWGVSPSTPVAIYDAAGGGMAAARAWWMLRAIGHDLVTVVDGGWQALRAEAVATQAGDARPHPVGRYPSKLDHWPTVDAELVEHARMDSTWRVIDARAPERYAGRTEPLDPVAGHIPGGHNLYWKSQVDDHGVFDSRAALRGRYSRILNDVPPERVVCYCGSGVTACHLLLAMDACGLLGAQLYVGSWSEWCRQGRQGATG